MERNLRKTRTGKVVSDKMDKTCVIQIKTRVRHPLYGKIMNQTSKLKVHDENNECGVGDTIRVMETRPLSHDKRWRLLMRRKVIWSSGVITESGCRER